MTRLIIKFNEKLYFQFFLVINTHESKYGYVFNLLPLRGKQYEGLPEVSKHVNTLSVYFLRTQLEKSTVKVDNFWYSVDKKDALKIYRNINWGWYINNVLKSNNKDKLIQSLNSDFNNSSFIKNFKRKLDSNEDFK